ncbi:MAG: 16S rRNA (uracil(1498)-N(3))-methyltransferase [Marinilabiliales bacterium]
MHIFYEPNINNNKIELNENETNHCYKVLRLREGEKVQVINGKGTIYNAIIKELNNKKCLLDIEDTNFFEKDRNYNLHIAIAPTKNIDRFEWFLEKSTEIGIDTITPLICSRSERKKIKHDRCEKIIISAMKQSKNLYKPVLNQLTRFKDFVKNNSNKDQLYIAHCNDDNIPLLKNIAKINKDITVLIGPEGDFTTDEVNLALANNYNEISLGNHRYRTETAGLIACQTIYILNL